ncbi:hypothetical protein J7M23_05295 [Candidatus Sumerlaeota bacterium]|nr:hypothetical protein [Candidatus Sumerlaeota bacterium]
MEENKEELRRIEKFLLHIKALVWCIIKAGERYNLSKIVKALRERKVPTELMASSVGQNLNYTLGFLTSDSDIETLIKAVQTSVENVQKRGGKKAELKHRSGTIVCEVGHYIQSVEQIDEAVPPGTYGVLCAMNREKIKGLFYVSGQGLKLAECVPDKVRFIFGTTIFSVPTQKSI